MIVVDRVLAAAVIVVCVGAAGCAGGDSADDALRPSNAWALEGNGDASAGDVDLTFAGTVRRTNEAVAFDGATGFARTDAPGPVITTQSFSVTVWVNLRGHAAFPTAVSQMGEVAAAFYLGYVEGSSWSFTMKTADASRREVTVRAQTRPTVPDPRAWVHLAGVYDHAARRIRLYVDGKRAAEERFTATWQATGPLVIGRTQGHAAAEGFWPGAVADVRIYPVALDDALVEQVFGERRPKSPPPKMPAPPPGFHCPHGSGECLGPLAPGTYASRVFEPQITYTVPAGWTNDEDLRGNFLLQLGGDRGYVGIYRNIAAPAGCEERVDSAVGSSVDALMTWLEAQPELQTTAPRPVTVGGLNGVRLDVSAPLDATGCFGRGIPLIIGGYPSDLTHDVPRGGTVRLYLLEYDDDNIVIEISRDAGNLKEYLQKATPVVEGLRFGA